MSRYIIESAEVSRPISLLYTRIPSPSLAPARRSAAERLMGRTVQILLGVSALGALMHEGLGTGLAVLATILVVPWLGALAFVMLDSAYLDLDGLLPATAKRTALAALALAFPGALLGWYGVVAILVLAVLMMLL